MTLTDYLDVPELLAAPGTYPVPPGRGRWRLTLHRRQFQYNNSLPPPAQSWQSTLICELPHAAKRVLTQAWDSSAQFVFALDGHDEEAAYIKELQHDVIAWRWDDTSGVDRPMFRGIIGQSADDITAERHTVTFTCHDYFAVLARRNFTFPSSGGTAYANIDQDTLVANYFVNWFMIAYYNGAETWNFGSGAYMPMIAQRVNPDGSARAALSGIMRTRSYLGGYNLGTAFDDLAKCINGFEYDVKALGMPDGQTDALRIFYPNQGVTRTAPILEYGRSIATIKRKVDSATFANYDFLLGNNQSAAPANQFYADSYTADSDAGPYGVWPLSENASDIIDQSTLNQRVAGNLALAYTGGAPVPSYELGLAPAWYYPGLFGMGDTMPLRIQSGRLQVNTTIRVLGFTYTVGDDGNEDVALIVGKPPTTLAGMFQSVDQDLNALARR